MQIFVKSANTFAVEVTPETTVGSIAQEIENKEFIQGFNLVCAGKALNNNKSLADYAIEDASTLAIQFPVAGGMRAKWRKKRMRRLRRKRRKMRQRAR